MTELIIRPLHLGTLIRDKSIFTYLKNMGQKIEVPVIAWYVEGKGRKILVDTGGHDPGRIDLHGPYSRPPQQDPVEALKAWGVDPEQIDTLILTHLHWDHASNIHLFPKARVIVQREELRYAAAPLAPHRWAYDLYPVLAVNNKRFEVIDGDAQIAEGVSVHLTPGHTPGLQGVAVRTSQKTYFIASDSVPLREMWNAQQAYGAPHWPGALHVDLETYTRSLKRIEGLGDAILPGHDPCIFEQREYR